MNDISSRLLDSLAQVSAVDDAKAQIERDKMNPAEFGGVEPDEDDYFNPNVVVHDVDIKEHESKVPVIPDSNAKDDADRVRNVTYALQDVSVLLLKDAVKMACETENPRAYTVCNDIMGTIRGLNKDLLDASKVMQEIQQKSKPLAEGETSVEVSDDGSVKVTKKPRGHSTKNLLALVEEMKRNGGKAEEINNNDFLEAEIEEAETSEIEDNDNG